MAMSRWMYLWSGSMNDGIHIFLGSMAPAETEPSKSSCNVQLCSQ
eukprot:CAMPEP_0194777408 /NCGR_PEP_ID=MMETSP0323_2-20130528/65568_1 /TAXON_ID=2866 ORGANISM="Crypthecodinium cohnii, Strain Seligo" /NCGR_SAMPLE_ID=MMETSP0323_2 /ASSEMBLY_ACC=CAM_ASM_000346 /LENGTH=44 /DNA_ID= /DNA_START= /DNA_END= /DNA_ORIENTATION=